MMYRHVIKLDPEHASAHYNLANLLCVPHLLGMGF